MAVVLKTNTIRSTLIAAASFDCVAPFLGAGLVQPGDLLLAHYYHNDNANAGTLTISDSGGSALSWTQIAITNSAGPKTAAWWAWSPDSTLRTVTVTHTGNASTSKQLWIEAWRGVSSTQPVPVGSVSSGTGGTNVSQVITPTADGGLAMLYMTSASALTTTALAGITRNQSSADAMVSLWFNSNFATSPPAASFTGATTEGVPVTIGETDTGGNLAWIACELRAKRLIPVLSAAAATGVTTSAATPQVTVAF